MPAIRSQRALGREVDSPRLPSELAVAHTNTSATLPFPSRCGRVPERTCEEMVLAEMVSTERSPG